MELSRPLVMGILNVTPDSFYAGSRTYGQSEIRDRVESMISDGADIIDIGGCSTRPGAADVSADEEYDRLARGIEAVREADGNIIVSIDTFRADVAMRCVDAFDIDIINDVSGGTLDPRMFATVAETRKAYVLMHMRGTPASMQRECEYDDVTAEVLEDLARKLADLRQLGVADVIVDPGFGFAKNTDQNFRMMEDLEAFKALNAPLLVGISRKSMIWRSLDCTPEESLNGTTVLNTVALMHGADILRVHDVKAAREAVTLVEKIQKPEA